MRVDAVLRNPRDRSEREQRLEQVAHSSERKYLTELACGIESLELQHQRFGSYAETALRNAGRYREDKGGEQYGQYPSEYLDRAPEEDRAAALEISRGRGIKNVAIEGRPVRHRAARHDT